MSNPEEIRRDIEHTRAELSDNVNALEDRSKPGNIARSQVDKVKAGANDLKERVFGSPEDPSDSGTVGEVGDRVSGAVGDMGDRASDVVHDARDAVSQAPQEVRRRTRGNPVAAGLIAAGVGALIGGLLPASRIEQDAAQRLKDAAEPVAEEVKGMVKDAQEHLQPKAQEALDEVKHTAQDATESVKQDVEGAKEAVAGQAKESGEHVRDEATTAVKDTQQDVNQARENL